MSRNLPPSWRLVLVYTALVMGIVVAGSVYASRQIADKTQADLELRLEEQAYWLRDLIAPMFESKPDPARIQAEMAGSGHLQGARLSVYGASGAVLVDFGSQGVELAEPSTPAEVRSALDFGTSARTRPVTEEGRKHTFVAVPIVLSGQTVGVARASSEAALSGDRTISTVWAIIVMGGLVVALSAGLAYLLVRRASRSAQALDEGTQRFARGDLDYRMDAYADDHAGQLAEAFNQMATAVGDRIRDLEAESAHLSVVLDTMADGVIVIDRDGRVELMNVAAQWMLQTRTHQAAGSQLTELVRDHELLQLVSEAASTGQTQQAELELVHRRRFLNAIATPLTEGVDHGVLLTLHDVTRLWQVETTRREFVSNVSHELRSPLAAIGAVTETLQQGALIDPGIAQDFLDRIQADVQRMTTMVNELLELSQLESGQVPVHLAPVDLGSVVNEVEARFDVATERKRLTLVNEVPVNIPLVMGEADKLNQVLGNLLDNAVKFTGDGGRISISAEADDRWVEIKVQDNGVGIAREHLPHLFERFYKVERSRRDGGTGLGLAIVKHLVEAHGGDIKAASIEGEGSTFSFTLPRAS